MDKKLQAYHNQETHLQHEVKDLKNEIQDVQRVEDDLIKKEITLESKLKQESWGEEGDDHEVHMRPLIPHFPRHEFGFRRHLDTLKD